MRRLPEIYIIGAQKSGTTTLYDWLAQHPQIYGHPLAKDYPYFSDERTHREGAGLFYSFARTAPDDKPVLGGDANAMYAPGGAERMFRTMPDARLVAILRDPVQRGYSAYCHAVERLLEGRSLEQAIHDELSGGVHYAPEDALRRDYLAHGCYAAQLREIYRFFAPDRVHVVIFEELRQDPTRVLGELFRFVGVSEAFEPNMAVKNQTKGGYRFKWIASLIHARPASAWTRKIGKALLPYRLRTTLRRTLTSFNRVERPKPDFPEHVRLMMNEYYKGEIAELETMLGRRIEIWQD